jgi:hypothetical protein
MLFHDIAILVVESKSDAPDKVLALLEENPSKKVIVINFEKYHSREIGNAFSNIIKYQNVRVITSVTGIMEDFIKYSEELKNAGQAEK